MSDRYQVRYVADTPLGRRFPTFVLATFATREAADAVRHECANVDQIEVRMTPPLDQLRAALHGAPTEEETPT